MRAHNIHTRTCIKHAIVLLNKLLTIHTTFVDTEIKWSKGTTTTALSVVTALDCSGYVVVLTSWLFWLRGCSGLVVTVDLEYVFTPFFPTSFSFPALYYVRAGGCVPSMCKCAPTHPSLVCIWWGVLLTLHTPHLKLTLCKVMRGLRFIMISIFFWVYLWM